MLTTSLDVLILQEVTSADGTEKESYVNCDSTAFPEQKRLEQQLDLVVRVGTDLNAGLDLVVFNASGFVVFAGGLIDDELTGTAIDTTEVYTVATDTVEESATLSVPRHGMAGAGNAEFGFVAGGTEDATSGDGSALKTIDHYYYPNKVVGPNVAYLTTGRHAASAAANETTGLIALGDDKTTLQSGSELYDLNTRTLSTGPTFAGGKTRTTAVCNKFDTYLVGGDDGSNSDSIERYSFITGTVSAVSSVLSSPRAGVSGTSTPSFGYLFGGDDGTQRDDIDILDMSTGTVSISGAVLGEGRSDHASGGTGTLALVGGGGSLSAGAALASTEKYLYDLNTLQSGSTLATGRKALVALSSEPGFLFGLDEKRKTVSLDANIKTTETRLALLDLLITV